MKFKVWIPGVSFDSCDTLEVETYSSIDAIATVVKAFGSRSELIFKPCPMRIFTEEVGSGIATEYYVRGIKPDSGELEAFEVQQWLI